MKYIRKIKKTLAQSPGTLVHIGERKTERVTMTLTRYDKDTLEEKEIHSPLECSDTKGFNGVCWLNVTGIHDMNAIEAVGNQFGIHPLVLEDIVNTMQRPKQEEIEDYLFTVLKMLYYDRDTKEVKSEHLSMILKNGTLITFQEQEGDVFDSVRERIRRNNGRIRKTGADYLFYALVDAVVDNYFLVLETMGEEIESLEYLLLDHPTPKILESVHGLKQELIYLRKGVWPLREVLSELLKSTPKRIKKETEIFLRDVYDHTIQVIETVETYRDMVAGLQDLYLSSVSNRMNEVMKVLTIIATIFIPLTFIAGIYGMNFMGMPELKWKYGYLSVWVVMILIAVIMVAYFKKKKWW
jgi:magnesium transporter